MEYMEKDEFTRRSKDFSCDNENLLNADVVIALDSSFDPPSVAHLALIRTAVEYHRSKAPKVPPRFAVVLLLATTNADKEDTAEDKAAEFEKRWTLINAFEQDVKAHFQGDESISFTKGLINAALFVDKYHILRAQVPCARLTFVMGYDTLVRVMDPRYYKGSDKADETHVLFGFFHDPSCRIVVLTRKPDRISGTPAALTDDLDAQTDILRLVKGSGVGNWRAQLIHMIKIFKSTSETEGVSSSIARKMLMENDSRVDTIVPPTVLKVITDKGLYKQ
ncbi:nicotinamide mononucleotide adenylyltransferase [Trichomonascus vanleenenianus]|uniref:nicotinamide-nucleotide adenylyltransferase n=1 Tax=Trichomonascus vanleenenianus TaxID=2268995 RepID=UPI003ECB2ED3